MEVRVPNKWVGKSARDLQVRTNYGVSILAVKREEQIEVSPDPAKPLRQNDILVVLGSNSDISRLTD